MDQILIVSKQWITAKKQKCHCSFRQNLEGRKWLLARSMGYNNNVWGTAFNSGHHVLRVPWTHIKNSKNSEETNNFYEEEWRNYKENWALVDISKEWNQRAILIMPHVDNICDCLTRVFASWWAHSKNKLLCWYRGWLVPLSKM